MRSSIAAVSRWWFSPVPRARIAVMRAIVYSFISIDVLVTTAWVARHAYVPTELYQPLFLGRVLPLPEPTTAVVIGVEIALLACAAVAASGRLPRLAGTAVALLYLEWMFIAMSYGKVDHDRVAFLVALAVLPTVGVARWRDRTPDASAGWAMCSIQVAVVLTYFLATFAKFRFGGIDWVTGATLMRAVLRRGTELGDLLVEAPWILQASQWLIVAGELASPLLLVPGRVGRRAFWVAVSFHAVTYSMIKIVFLPHVVCLLSFLPLERLTEFLPGRDRALVVQQQTAGSG